MRRLQDLLTTRGRAFTAAGLTLVVCGIGLGFSDLTRIGVLLVGLPLISAAVMRSRELRYALSRTVRPSRVQVDEAAIITVSMENVGPATSPLLMGEEQLDYALGDRPRFIVPRMRRGERREIHYTVRSHVRGRHRLGPLGVRLRDPFGLSTRVAAISGTGELIVLPRVLPLGSGAAPGVGIGAEGSIPHMVALHGEDDVSIRAYRDGDDLRRIHWPATARTGDLMVRQEDRPARRRALVLLDSRASAHRGSGSASSFEWAVTACASTVAYLLGQAYAVHLLSTQTAADGTSTSAIDLDEALDVLAVAETGRDENLVEVLHAAQPLAGSGGLVLAVLGELDEDAARSVAALRQPGSVGVALVVDAAQFGGRGRGAEPVCAAVLRTAGWSTVVVGPEDTVPAAWSVATGAGVGMSR